MTGYTGEGADSPQATVLDKGFVRLVDHMGDDSSVVQAARVAYGQGTKSVREDRDLIRYLMRHRHTSPFEHVIFKFHVKAPLFVVAQWVRHRTWSYNFVSYRYSEAPDEFYMPERFRLQSGANKQGSGELVNDVLDRQAHSEFSEVMIAASDSYKYMVGENVAREMARMILPQNLYTEFYATVDLHNLLHFLSLRLDAHAQWEIREYARVIQGLVQGVVPECMDAWWDYSYFAESFSRNEMYQIRRLLNGLDPDYIGMTKSEQSEFWKKLDIDPPSSMAPASADA